MHYADSRTWRRAGAQEPESSLCRAAARGPGSGEALEASLQPSPSQERLALPPSAARNSLCSAPTPGASAELSKCGCGFHPPSLGNIWGKKMSTRHDLKVMGAKARVAAAQRWSGSHEPWF